MENKKVFVSGFFDLIHAGHIEFLRQAAELGDLFVALGTDKNISLLKGIKPTYNEKERIFILQNLKTIKEVFLASGSGKIDFLEDLKRIQPDIFVVNEDGHSIEKQKLCEALNIEYKILKRIPAEGLPPHSSTELRAKQSKIPHRISISGGWLDQPYISKIHPGPNLTISIEPNNTFNFRSGMASSTRNSAIKLWGNQLPEGDSIHLAKILFSFDNPPGTEYGDIAGAQDSIGLIVPGLAYSYYNGKYWPSEIRTHQEEDILSWLEDKFYLVELKPREMNYTVFEGTQWTEENAKALADASEKCYRAILNKDFESFAEAFTESFNAQTTLFPATFPEWIKPLIEKYKNLGAKGWKLSGAGGGGYLILVSEIPIENGIKIKIRRN